MIRLLSLLAVLWLLAGCATTNNKTVVCKRPDPRDVEELRMCEPKTNITDNAWYNLGMTILSAFEGQY